jgi:glycosyltransferase involved in cell wall biosynthesis
MGFRVVLCASEYPQQKSTERIGINVSDCIDVFVQGVKRTDIIPLLKSYQMAIYSYFAFRKLIRKHKLQLVIVTGPETFIPRNIASKTIVYVYFPVGLFVAGHHSVNNRMKRLQGRCWRSLSNISRSTIITSSKYEKNLIKTAYGLDAAVIYPPCPQYSYESSQQKEDIVCTLARFVPEKGYDTILEIASMLPSIQFELVGSVKSDTLSYLEELRHKAPRNVMFHVNATLQEKKDILKKSKVLLHSFLGEHFGIGIIEAMSAGIIPVTHNSGAAKVDELVPERFRYNDTHEAVQMVNDALSFWSPAQAMTLHKFAKTFSPEVFDEKMKALLSNFLKKSYKESKISEP